MGLDGGPGYIYSEEHTAEVEPKENGPEGIFLGRPPGKIRGTAIEKYQGSVRRCPAEWRRPPLRSGWLSRFC